MMMKQYPKQTAAVLLSCLLTVSLGNSFPAMAQTAPQLYLSAFETASEQMKAIQQGTMFQKSFAPAGDALPSAFDLREKGLVSAVKEQALVSLSAEEETTNIREPYQNCWAFAAMNALETSQIAARPAVDLSEWYLSYYMYCGNFGYPTTQESVFNEGSHDAFQELGMLTGWIGPVSEPMAVYGSAAITESGLNMEEVQKQAEYHVTDASIYGDSAAGSDRFADQLQTIKEAVYSGHAVSARYTACDACLNEETSAYLFSWDTSGETPTETHSISIVGWDDSFAAGNFRSDPGMDGAWLVKNSWGTNWGEYGYFWVSYAEELRDIYSLEAKPAADGESLYQYDSYGSTGAFSVEEGGDITAAVANIFTADTDLWVTSAMFYAAQAGDSCEIMIYTNLTDAADPTSGKLAASVTTEMAQVGYHTVDLKNAVSVRSGEKFAVVARIDGEKGSHIPCEYASHTEWTNTDGTTGITDSIFTPDMLRRNFQAGESFYSTDGLNWTDMYEVPDQTIALEEAGTTSVSTLTRGNICLKAVTTEAGRVQFSEPYESVPADTVIALSSLDGADIYYSLNGGDYMPYEEPIPFSEHVTIQAYADMGEKVVSEGYYQEKQPAISSLLCIEEDGSSWYLHEDELGSYQYYGDSSVSTLKLMPISTGTVTYGDTVLPSGKVTEIAIPAGSDKIALQITQDDVTTTSYLFLEAGAPAEELLGDVNLNGQVNAEDAALVLEYAAKVGAGETPELPDKNWLIRADFDKSGTADAGDASGILVYAAEIGAGA